MCVCVVFFLVCFCLFVFVLSICLFLLLIFFVLFCFVLLLIFLGLFCFSELPSSKVYPSTLLDKAGRLSTIFDQGDNLNNFLCAYLRTKKWICPGVANYFLSYQTPFQKGNQNHFD